jgi:glyceraldehyde 3-phosphate dehydrogenase
MRIRVGINGMGRIGRAVLRGVIERDDTAVEVVAVNDLTPVATLAHLLRYDSTYGRRPVGIEVDSEHLSVGGRLVRAFGESDPAALDWRCLVVDVVVEATGRFRTRGQAAVHLVRGARKVVLTSPGKDVDVTVVSDPASCVLDAGLTIVTGDLVKVFGWYDNEWGYAQRTVDLVDMIARTLPDRTTPHTMEVI